MTSSAISTALGSQNIFHFGNRWKACSNFAKVVKFVKKSKSLGLFSTVKDDPTSPFFFSSTPWKKEEEQELKKETYHSLLQSKVEAQEAFLFAFDWVQKEIQTITPAIQTDPLTGKKTLHLTKGRDIFEIVRRPLLGMKPIIAKEFVCVLNTPLVEALARGPLRGVAPLPWFVHAQKQNEFMLEWAPKSRTHSQRWLMEGEDEGRSSSSSPSPGGIERLLSSPKQGLAKMKLPPTNSHHSSPPPLRWGFKPQRGGSSQKEKR